jgi:hypothetical protein
MKKLLLLAGAALAMSACADATTAPTRKAVSASDKSSRDLTCRSGYVIAYDENGNPYCAPDGSGTSSASRPQP